MRIKQSWNRVHILSKCHCIMRTTLFASKLQWLLQESERLLSDRLFRVRAKMPGEAKSPSKVSPLHTVSSQPIKAEYLVVGDPCAFKTLTTTPQFKIGKVLQFILFDKKGKS